MKKMIRFEYQTSEYAALMDSWIDEDIYGILTEYTFSKDFEYYTKEEFENASMYAVFDDLTMVGCVLMIVDKEDQLCDLTIICNPFEDKKYYQEILSYILDNMQDKINARYLDSLISKEKNDLIDIYKKSGFVILEETSKELYLRYIINCGEC